jgi:3-polyprenyl-4-hydroxybenzoate decarboxylase
VRAYEGRGRLDLMGEDGLLRCFEGSSAEFVAILLDALREPRSESDIVRRVDEVAGTTKQSARPAVAEALGVLESAGAIRRADAKTPGTKAAAAEPRKVVVALSGGIAAAHAPALIELLQGRGCHVRVAATPSALRFVRKLSLEAMTHEPVVARLLRAEVPHIALARWAEAVVVYPATATTLSRIARGDCSNVVSALAISTRAPVLLVPAMNEAMIDAPSVRRNLEQLKEDGFLVSFPALGYEVAETPERRRPAFGAALPVQAVAELALAVLRTKP